MKLNNALIKGSFVLLILFGVFNFFNFVFQLSMARMLTLEEYGVFATLFSVVYMCSVLTESVQTITTKYSAQANSLGKVKNIIKKSLRKALQFSGVIVVLFLTASLFLTKILNVNYSLLALTSIFIILAFLTPITRGVMQGRKKFSSLGFNMVMESFFKLVLAVSFVILGWKIYGALIGAILGVVISFLLSFIPLKNIIRSKEESSKTEEIYSYARPAFLITLILVLFYSLDIVIAKIVFPVNLAGAYAVASVLSKIIFWGTQPISKAMFPLSSEVAGRSGKKSENIFTSAVFFISLLVLPSLAIFYLFPGKIISIFSGKELYDSVSILFYLGIGTSLLSFSNLLLLHKLSLNKIKNYTYLFVFLLLEIFLLFNFSSNLIQFSLAFVTASAIFLWGILFIMKD